ncbi:uncharacterized protein GLRG_10615 [Colletotrichum graminicola M1.001]|uniref:Uncharacterized protein n=1 Tax=Colletotrichum graminicola (strain M1.001 / M2 / FGSC 10212) TaxID=645133 RepID=E3QX83_COLGM|nr:uncharacterized protein GLRG_10615 [Colletotrichum graminicola M1.001]EFQ35471.1 hypothetical protein GLRG_10615 [Colletotrichum graminicola M1.001]
MCECNDWQTQPELYDWPSLSWTMSRSRQSTSGASGGMPSDLVVQPPPGSNSEKEENEKKKLY